MLYVYDIESNQPMFEVAGTCSDLQQEVALQAPKALEVPQPQLRLLTVAEAQWAEKKRNYFS
ncbi:hypothetical protein [Andreprevotia chitinilytica]|uniref:hypothetical protein n=1 Tax=Andreprevotia chitinilytica TaxID=396808 RepID=UPI00055092B3|nr:hypothetical protein [Andreprevotia chitinilytica]